MKKVKAILIIVIITLLFAACEGEYLDVETKKGEGYVYSIGETVEFMGKDSDKVVAILTIDSCEMVDDTPFIVKEEIKTRITNDEGEEEIVSEWKETEYTALYEVCLRFDSTNDYNIKPGSHFSSEEVYFKVNPKKESTYSNKFYIGAKKGNNGDGVVTVNFDYFHYANYVMFDIVLDEIASEDSTEEPEYIIVEGGEKVVPQKEESDRDTKTEMDEEEPVEEGKVNIVERVSQKNTVISVEDVMALLFVGLGTAGIVLSIIFIIKWRNLKKILKKNTEAPSPDITEKKTE